MRADESSEGNACVFVSLVSAPRWLSRSLPARICLTNRRRPPRHGLGPRHWLPCKVGTARPPRIDRGRLRGGALDKQHANLYREAALSDRTKLPAKYRSPAIGKDATYSLVQMAREWSSLPRSTQQEILDLRAKGLGNLRQARRSSTTARRGLSVGRTSSSSFRPATVKLNLTFDGADGFGWRAVAIATPKNGGAPTVYSISLDSASAGSISIAGFGTTWSKVTLVPAIVGTDGSGVPYSYGATVN